MTTLNSRKQIEPSIPFRGGGDEELASRIALAILVVALASYLGAATLHLLMVRESLVQLVVGGSALVAIFVVQVIRSVPRSTRLRRRHTYWILAVQALLTYVPVLLLGPIWVGLPGFLSGTLLLSFRPPWSWLTAGLVLSSVMGLAYFHGMAPLEVAYVGVSCLLLTTTIYGLTWLAEMVVQLRSAQREIARLAVEKERLRFARDLHDLLGYSLSAITLRGELTLRLIDQQPGRAAEELSTVLEISRQALADVRAVARSYRDLSFPTELESAKSVFHAAGIHIEVKSTLEELPEQVSTVFATVLREGITNILRHSAVRHCTVTAKKTDNGTAVLHVVNDGVDDSSRPHSVDGGSGIGNLCTRISAVGGRLVAGVRKDGRFHLVAEVPLRAQGPEPVRPLRIAREVDRPDGARSAV
ncbi:histidine kinase [Streptomyces sp. NBC_01142]|uniref:sensor histidine kinase n=1 Tax=Streptomyces sp. NBC_01142 TaxID=2975865 RepID=UPI00224FB4EE|nr:histidine kinase [Streptomyces sp. NBC_01142]MCX4820523.1 histidine kinase [Streptomyces sp. NBC_01142]